MKRFAIIFAVCAMRAACRSAEACPFCSTGTSVDGGSSGTSAAVAGHYSISILFMLGGILATALIVGRTIVRAAAVCDGENTNGRAE